MTAPIGRPKRGTTPPMSPFGEQVAAALRARLESMAHGPRTLADLARAIGIRPDSMRHGLSGARQIPPATEALIRAALPELQEMK
jgi:hypothetical protein